MAGQVYAVAGESPVWQHSMHWDLEKPSDRWDSLHDLRVAKSEHGDVWVEHDDLPFQVRMLKTKYGLYAGDIHWVKGETCDGDLLLENARRLPQFATNLWEEVKVVDMQNNIKLSLLAAIKASGSTKSLACQWRLVERCCDQFFQTSGHHHGHGPQCLRQPSALFAVWDNQGRQCLQRQSA
mmetsp:Transcript_109332/g.178487  ORF Transcript_109332/g.178487 Transcript_109332/m.178487 type:complete len:181 (-) Transcript_109332:341-883(-)